MVTTHGGNQSMNKRTMPLLGIQGNTELSKNNVFLQMFFFFYRLIQNDEGRQIIFVLMSMSI